MCDGGKRKPTGDQERASEEARARLIMGEDDRRDADEDGAGGDQRSGELSSCRTKGGEHRHAAEDEV